MGEYLVRALQERHASPTDDAYSDLIQRQIERDGEFNLRYLTSEAGMLLLAGLVTSGHAIANTMHLLVTNPDQLAEVQADPPAAVRMFEESLRVEGPVQWLARYVLEDTEVAGESIPAGATVILSLAAANRDERVFERAAEFDADRGNAAGAPCVRLRPALLSRGAAGATRGEGLLRDAAQPPEERSACGAADRGDADRERRLPWPVRAASRVRSCAGLGQRVEPWRAALEEALDAFGEIGRLV